MNSISKRFISITAMGAVVLSSFTCAFATDHESDDIIKIYFTNDVHCAYENYARAASIIGDKDLLIDAGDNIQGDIIGTISDGGYMVDIMNYMGYDAAVPGNHEFDYGIDRFFEIVRGSDDVPKLADCDYISCNFRDIVSGAPVLEPYKIYEAEGKKVAVVGISTPETLTKSNPANLKNEDGEWIYDFSNDKTGEILYETVQSAVDSAREQDVDYVIAVGHLGTDEESEPWTSSDVIANTTGIDAFIDGHSHEAYTASVKNENGEEIPVAQTGTKLENIGCMTIDEEGGISAQLIKIDENIAEDSKTKEFIDGIAAEIEDIKNEVVASSDVKLTTTDPQSGERIIRNRETNLGDLCADAYRAITGADIAFVNGGGIRADIDMGEITYGDIIAVHPFGNEACMIEVTGQQIADALEWASASNPEELGGFLQVSGLSYEIHNYIESPCESDESGGFQSIGDGERRVRNIRIGGEEIDYNKKYTLAGHNYMLLDLGDGFNMFKGADKLLESVAIDNQVIIKYITENLNGNVSADSVYGDPYGEGRIKIVSSKPEENVSFDDVVETDWFFDAVLYASQNGIMQGINDDQFSPYSEVTRAMAVTVLYRMTEGSAGSKSSSFSDVDENAYYALAVDWASENGIVNGYSDTVFAPDDAVTREQLALILYRYAILTGRDISLNGNLSAFADCENISDYAYEAVEWANGNELINGNGDGTINPTGKTTRAELASILMRYSEAE